MTVHIHQEQKILKIGANIEEAELIVILLHGRGATAESMLPIANAMQTSNTHFLIPQAAHNRWYPNTAFGPLEANEPDLSSALQKIADIIDDLKNQGFSTEQIAIGGFSQGACLAAEFVARNAMQYAGVFIYSGALIGPPGMERAYQGSLDQTPIFIGGSDIDPWINHDFMQEAAKVFEQMDANVDFRTYSGMGHTVNEDEINAVKSIFNQAIRP
jgi:predicted esterase